MIDASESAHSLAGLEIYAERETRVKVGNATKALTNRIEGMKRKMANLAAHAKNADPAVKKSIGRQIGKVEDEVSRLEASKNKIIDIRNKILDVLAKGRRVLHVVKEDAKKVEGLAKEVGAIENSMEKAEKHMDESIKRMREAHNSFQADIAAIDQGALPEEVLIKARGHATAIFEEIKKFIDMAIVIQQNDVLPMIQKNSQILQTSFRIEKADRFASRVQKFVNDSLEQLAIVLAAVGTPQEKAEAEKLKKVDEFQNDINRYAERKGKKIMAEVKKSYGDLGEAMKAAQTQLQYLNAQKGKVDAAEKETASALDSGLKELGEMRKKQAAQMEGALKQASNDLAKAQAAERREKRAA
ncbi:TPA: hypothetical protein HA265_03680 [Candidatus Woesearchaeota archaeon]|nr:hypothetical protein [Candidatus Woesearchaeota archaeon]